MVPTVILLWFGGAWNGLLFLSLTDFPGVNEHGGSGLLYIFGSLVVSTVSSLGHIAAIFVRRYRSRHS